MKIPKTIFAVGLILLMCVSPALAQTTTRVTFSHEESFSWSNSEPTYGFTVEWNLSIIGNVSFTVDFDVYNNGTIDPASDDEVYNKLLTPEGEGNINITVIGDINVTKVGVVPVSGHKEVEKSTSLAVTTPMGEWQKNVSIPIPVPVGPIIVTVTIIPTLYINSSISANATVQGLATISETELLWTMNGEVEITTVHSSSDAQIGDEIVLTVKDISYDWNASITVELKLEGMHLITSPPYQFETQSLPADDEVTVPFHINVVPEFTTVALIATLTIATSAVLIAKRKLMKTKIW